MAWNDGLLKLPPVASMFGMVGAMDQVFGAERWTCEFRGLASHCCLAKVTVTLDDGIQVIREALATEGWGPWHYAEVAALRAYEFIGGKVNWPKLPAKVEEPKAALPRPAGTPSAKPITHSLPSAYSGPVPYNDSHTNIPPVSFPKPPQEPEWFGRGIGGWATWKNNCPWTKDVTWHQAVHQEIENPGGRDQPLGYIMRMLGKDKVVEPHLRGPWSDFVGKAKAACIWAMLAKEQRREQEAVDQEQYSEAELPPEDNQTPF